MATKTYFQTVYKIVTVLDDGKLVSYLNYAPLRVFYIPNQYVFPRVFTAPLLAFEKLKDANDFCPEWEDKKVMYQIWECIAEISEIHRDSILTYRAIREIDNAFEIFWNSKGNYDMEGFNFEELFLDIPEGTVFCNKIMLVRQCSWDEIEES